MNKTYIGKWLNFRYITISLIITLLATIIFFLLFTKNNNIERKSNLFLSQKKSDSLVLEKHFYQKIVNDTTIKINNVLIDIKPNDSLFSGNILILPGWNFKKSLWCDSTSFCKEAIKNGYRLILPEMGKSIYSSCYFPETRKDWIKYPKLSWLTDSLIPALQNKYGILLYGDKNYIIGLSTGARGALQTALKTDSLFQKIAALSGDYNQLNMPNDKLMIGYYGSITKFKNRWDTVDNIVRICNKAKFSIYIGHGMNDKIVSVKQSKELYDSLINNKTKKRIILSLKENYGHNFTYWRSEVTNILLFFNRND
jgi:hypothetical protein